VGSASVLTSCEIEDEVIIGQRCIVLEGAIVEKNAILADGTLVAENQLIPSGQLWAGNPAVFVRAAQAPTRRRRSLRSPWPPSTPQRSTRRSSSHSALPTSTRRSLWHPWKRRARLRPRSKWRSSGLALPVAALDGPSQAGQSLQGLQISRQSKALHGLLRMQLLCLSLSLIHWALREHMAIPSTDVLLCTVFGMQC